MEKLIFPLEIPEDPILLPDEYIDMSFFNEPLALPLLPDRSILKQLLHPGSFDSLESSSEFPLAGALVYATLDGRKSNGELLDKSKSRFFRKKIKLFCDDYIEGLHIAISSMRKNEVSWFKIAPKYHYFSQKNEENRVKTGCEDLVNEHLFYRIELLDFKNLEKSLEKNDFEGRIAKFENSRKAGNELFAKSDYEKAFKFYRISIELLLKFPKALKQSLLEEQKEKLNFYAEILYGNAVLCKMRQKRWSEGVRLVNEGLKLFPLNAKILIRKGICLMKCGEAEKARSLALDLLKKEPGNEDAGKIVKECEDFQTKEKINEKRSYRKIFEKWEEEEKSENLEKKRRIVENAKEKGDARKNRDLVAELQNGVVMDMKDPCNELITSEEDEDT